MLDAPLELFPDGRSPGPALSAQWGVAGRSFRLVQGLVIMLVGGMTSESTEVRVIDPDTGATVWTTTRGDGAPWRRTEFAAHGPAIVLVRSSLARYELVALHPKTGRELWHKAFKSDTSEVTFAGSTLCCRDHTDVVALDFAEGKELWRTEGRILEASQNLVLVVGSSGGLMSALVPRSGKRLWSVPLTAQWVTPVGALVVAQTNFELTALSTASGRELWKWARGTSEELRMHIEAFDVLPGPSNVVVRHALGLSAFDPSTGSTLWEYRTPEGTRVGASGEELFVWSYSERGDEDACAVLDMRTGYVRARSAAPGRVAEFVGTDGGDVLVSGGDRVGRLRRSEGGELLRWGEHVRPQELERVLKDPWASAGWIARVSWPAPSRDSPRPCGASPRSSWLASSRSCGVGTSGTTRSSFPWPNDWDHSKTNVRDGTSCASW